MKTTACWDHDHLLREAEVSLAREIGRKTYEGESSHRPEESVWGWIVLRKDGSICHGYGSEPGYGKKQWIGDNSALSEAQSY